jgi:hypothetical protein
MHPVGTFRVARETVGRDLIDDLAGLQPDVECLVIEPVAVAVMEEAVVA